MKTCGLCVVFLFRQVHDHDALGDADLYRRKPDAGRGIHGLEHVLDQRADAGVDALDRLGIKPQPLVGKYEDLAHSHSSPSIGAM